MTRRRQEPDLCAVSVRETPRTPHWRCSPSASRSTA